MNFYNSLNIYQKFKLTKDKEIKTIITEVLEYMIKNAENGVLMVEKQNFSEFLD